MAALLSALKQARCSALVRRRWLTVALPVSVVATATAVLFTDSRPDTPAGASATTKAGPGGELADVPANPYAEILAASDLPEIQPTPAAEDPTGITMHRLTNGLTVYLCPRTEVPRIQARIVIRVGAQDDPPEAPGAAALLASLTEHGTAKLGARECEREKIELDEIARLVDQLGRTSQPQARTAVLAAIARAEERAQTVADGDEYNRVLEDLDITQRLKTLAQVGLQPDTLTRLKQPNPTAAAFAREYDTNYANAIGTAYAEGKLPGDQPAAGDRDIQRAARSAAAHYVLLTRAAPPSPAAAPAFPPLGPQTNSAGNYSPFASELLTQPHSAEEPQFIVEGRHYITRRGPGGTAVAAQCDRDVTHLSVLVAYPNPPSIEACHAYVSVAYHLIEPMIGEGGHLSLTCPNNYLVLERSAVGPIPNTLLTPLTTWADGLEQTGGLTRGFDVALQNTPGSVPQAVFHRNLFELLLAYAMFPGRLHTTMPKRAGTDKAIGPSIALWERIAAAPVNYAYCGPDPEGFLSRAPIDAPRETPARHNPADFSPRARPATVVLDLPESDETRVALSVGIPAAAHAPNRAIGNILSTYLSALLSQRIDPSRDVGADGAQFSLIVELPAAGHDGYVQVQVAGAAAELPAVAEAIAEVLTQADVDALAFARAKAKLERDIPTTRLPNREIPAQVLQWYAAGLNSDPRLETWAQLPSVTQDSFATTWRTVAAGGLVIALAGDLSHIDLTRIARIAPVQRISVDKLARWDEQRRAGRP